MAIAGWAVVFAGSDWTGLIAFVVMRSNTSLGDPDPYIIYAPTKENFFSDCEIQDRNIRVFWSFDAVTGDGSFSIDAISIENYNTGLFR